MYARSQNTEKATHINLKGKLLDQAWILYSKWLLPPSGSEFFPLRAVLYGMENHFYQIELPPLNVDIFIMHVRKCVMGATPMTRQLSF